MLTSLGMSEDSETNGMQDLRQKMAFSFISTL